MLSVEDRVALTLGRQILRNCSLEAQLEEVVANRDMVLKRLHELEPEKEKDEQPEAAPVGGAAEAS